MKLAYSVLVDVDPHTPTGPRTPFRDEAAELLRAHLVKALQTPPIDIRGARVFGRATPERVKRMDVESLTPLPNGRYKVTVRVEDNRTTSRTFPTRHAAETWADRIDPVFLPGDPTT